MEQAYTYANHPEVQATYYVLCNGKSIWIFEPNRGPTEEPIVSLAYDQFEHSFHILEGVLSPTSINRRCRPTEVDLGRPLAPGLRSSEQITNGEITYSYVDTPDLATKKQLEGTIVHISEGRCFRSEEGQINAEIRAVFPNEDMHNLNKQYGMDFITLQTIDKTISTDENHPTIFESYEQIVEEAGHKFYDLNTRSFVEMPFDIQSSIYTEAVGFWNGEVFQGKFFGRIVMSIDKSIPDTVVEMTGAFSIHLEHSS